MSAAFRHDRRLRILLVAPSQGVVGGIESFVLALAEYLAARDELDLRICFKLVAGYSLSAALRDELNRSGLPYRVTTRASAALAREIRWADLVHGQNASPDVCLLARLLRKHLVLTIHNHLHGRNGARVMLWRRAMRLADRRWYNSAFVRASWETGGPTVRSEAFPTVSRIRRSFAPIESRLGFVFVARMIPNKGARDLLTAYGQADIDRRAWPLRLVGDGPLLAELEQEFASSPGVRFEGFVSQERKEELIGAARWMVTPPNTREDMGLTPLEARSKGVPCIVSADGGLPEVAGSEAMLFQPGDVAGLRACLELAARMPSDHYASLAANAFGEVANLIRPMGFYVDSYLDVARRGAAPGLSTAR